MDIKCQMLEEICHQYRFQNGDRDGSLRKLVFRIKQTGDDENYDLATIAHTYMKHTRLLSLREWIAALEKRDELTGDECLSLALYRHYWCRSSSHDDVYLKRAAHMGVPHAVYHFHKSKLEGTKYGSVQSTLYYIRTFRPELIKYYSTKHSSVMPLLLYIAKELYLSTSLVCGMEGKAWSKNLLEEMTVAFESTEALHYLGCIFEYEKQYRLAFRCYSYTKLDASMCRLSLMHIKGTAPGGVNVSRARSLVKGVTLTSYFIVESAKYELRLGNISQAKRLLGYTTSKEAVLTLTALDMVQKIPDPHKRLRSHSYVLESRRYGGVAKALARMCMARDVYYYKMCCWWHNGRVRHHQRVRKKQCPRAILRSGVLKKLAKAKRLTSRSKIVHV